MIALLKEFKTLMTLHTVEWGECLFLRYIPSRDAAILLTTAGTQIEVPSTVACTNKRPDIRSFAGRPCTWRLKVEIINPRTKFDKLMDFYLKDPFYEYISLNRLEEVLFDDIQDRVTGQKEYLDSRACQDVIRSFQLGAMKYEKGVCTFTISAVKMNTRRPYAKLKLTHNYKAEEIESKLTRQTKPVTVYRTMPIGSVKPGSVVYYHPSGDYNASKASYATEVKYKVGRRTANGTIFLQGGNNIFQLKPDRLVLVIKENTQTDIQFLHASRGKNTKHYRPVPVRKR